MRHRKEKFRLNRFTSWRKSTIRALARSLLLHQSIRTTKNKAMAAKPLAEKLISLGKTGTLEAKRQAYKILGDHRLVSALFKEIAPRFSARNGGYLRILNWAKRRGDNAQMCVMELTEIKKKEIVKPKAKKEAAKMPSAEKPLGIPAKEERPPEERKPKTEAAVKEKPPITKKPSKKFLGGLRSIFKKERDSL